MGKNVGNDRFWLQVMSTFEGRFAPPWTVKYLPNLLVWYLQCYLDPEVAIYLKQYLFMDELIPLIKNGVNLKVKGEKLLIYDDLAMFGDQLLNQLTNQK